METTEQNDNFTLDCMIKCFWSEEGEIKLSDYEDIINYYVLKKMMEQENAKTVRFDEITY